ncbi:glycerophosphoryl diester phosphodiesterase membrane domain-containing protein [Streptomyces sp. 1331.2]|uniref:glycerophosphoryl diester phosphodiesterase membrane domain-containing protein n=1 Tax=Streptomyces sp. 1331.2 TaxID=1938835 RepID=UPI000BC9F396|nr:glycerophosphoryl diester phosphodiesterase membrane domain-containing protein [Streptomyces sp. 1331.2]SOB83847.1 Membrane domain of glycerophosphoryl diester phosphodiesterase [Streptomyces sp. 1331.2]
MTDTPGWASPGSSEQPRDGVRPPADAPAAVPGPSAPPQTTPGWDGQYGQSQHGRPQWGQQPPGGHRPYGWGAPQSPRPGVIPLRPLGIGELLDGAVTTVRRHWRTVLALSLGIAVVAQAGTVLVDLLVRGRTGAATQTLRLLAAMPLQLLLDVLAAALLTIVVSRAVLGRSASAGEAWRDARPRLLQLLGLTVLTVLMGPGVALLGFAPLVGYRFGGANEPATAGLLFLVGLLTLPVAAWLWIRYSLAAPALMLEKQGVTTALSRSRRLVRGSWWRVFGIVLLGKLLSVVVAVVIAVPFRFVGLLLGFDSLNRQGFADTTQQTAAMVVVMAIAGIIAGTLTTPFMAAVGVLVYVDQRIRREALDIELARAAGLPEYGDAGWSEQSDQTPARR